LLLRRISLREKPQFALQGEPAEGHDPFRRVYPYGEERQAAEDAAFLFFRVWGSPVNSRLYVSSASFSGAYEWERIRGGAVRSPHRPGARAWRTLPGASVEGGRVKAGPVLIR
jgi:hypothetical protein